MKAVFDTNILIDFLAGREEADEELEYYDSKLVSIVTYLELLAGANTDEESKVLKNFLHNFKLVALNRNVAATAADLRSEHRLGFPDSVIWATAQVEQAVLVTRDAKGFPADHPGIRVPY